MAYDAKHDDIIKLLIERGANVEGQFDYRGRLLHRASADGRTEVVRMVLQRKADVHIRGDDGRTALKTPTASGHREVEQLLLDNGAKGR